jgi:hypothetical protein
MRLKAFMPVMTGLLAVALVGETLAAADQANPYQSIVDRNAFGLREPPPPPAPPAPPPPPPVARPIIKLKGWTSLFTKPRALLQITEQGEKPQNMILSENERQGEIEVKSIDMEKNEVVLSVSGFITNVTFAKKEASAPTPPGRPPVPGRILVPNTGSVPGRPPSAASASPPSGGGPTIISRNSPRSAVTLLGGNASGAPAADQPTPAPSTPATYNASATAANRLRSVPTRSIRTSPNAAQQDTPARPQMTREEVMALIEAQRATRPDIRSILPPTSATPPDQ